MITLGNSFRMLFEVAGEEVSIDPSMIKTFAISHSTDFLVPSIKIVFSDSAGALSHMLPSSKSERSMKIALGYSTMQLDEYIQYDFMINRKFMDTERNLVLEGIVNVPNLFTGDYCKTFAVESDSTIHQVLSAELTKIFSIPVEVSPSLMVGGQTFIMPCCTYAEFLRQLPYELSTITQGSGYYVIFQCDSKGTKLCINNYSDVVTKEATYKFFTDSAGYQDHLPVYSYTIYDNTGLKNTKNIFEKNYMYFDYVAGEYVSETIKAQDKESMTDYINADVSAQQGKVYPTYLGRTNKYNRTFKSLVNNVYSHELMDLVQMELFTMALPEIQIGAVVDLKFAQGFENPSNMLMAQHQGRWVVRGYSHTIRKSELYTNLILVRSGINTELSPALIQATS